MKDVPDAELMQRAASGETDAFAALVEKYQNILLNFFLRRGVSYNDGQDLAQQTFLRLWKYRKKYTPRAKFTTFLFLLAGQVSVDFYRAEGRRSGLEENLMHEAEASSGASPKMEGEPAASATGADVRHAVARLPPGLRDVVELGVFQDLPYAEVGEILGIPTGTVKSRMFNALRKLKDMLT